MVPSDRADTPASNPWIELTLRLPLADAEVVADALAALAPGGAALEPPFQTTDRNTFAHAITDGDALVRAFFPAPLPPAERRALRARLSALPLRGALPRLRYSTVEDVAWDEAWKEHFRPVRIGRVLVRPPWDESDAAGDAAEGDAVIVVLDPGRAFGTGQHPTTRLCLAALQRLVRRGDAVLDVGTGSGVLAIAAIGLGAERAHALDVDPDAAEAARANADRNGVASVIDVRVGTLAEVAPFPEAPAAGYDLVVANISSAAVIEEMPALARALKPGGHAVVSGFFEEAAPRIEAAARATGLEPEPVLADDEWRALVAVRPVAS